MRSDMSKVIVERPRRRRPGGAGSDYPRGHLQGRWWPDLEAAPKREAMRRAYGDKYLNENLQPLARFLRKQVGRPWDKVRSEIAAHVSCTSAVQKHVLDHLRDYVAEHVRMEGRTPYTIRFRGWEALTSSGSWLRFFVCPRTGLLRLAPVVPRKRRAPPPDPNLRVLADDRVARRIDGIWYELTLGRSDDSTTTEPWLQGRFIAAKRQLGSRELVRLGL